MSVRALDKVADNQPSDGMPRTDCLSLASTNVPFEAIGQGREGSNQPDSVELHGDDLGSVV